MDLVEIPEARLCFASRGRRELVASVFGLEVVRDWTLGEQPCVCVREVQEEDGRLKEAAEARGGWVGLDWPNPLNVSRRSE